ncbi:malto-oligosyltrehalose trehalohydrolase [Nitrosococcus oceani]|uniref:Malto-oligosyltrehalose trehalohydrolase n=2 Tax=Nitrosococcus oceani TaxID=1229 RepID=Q3JAJ3_NITOC|nr:malto-oligosyltrehalose trehalohydrolase [Nitrosococcus oceani]KFI19484.1 1,4-alpha-glucan branching protein [Nitrosococcus oceani C-27]ABA58153.1 maltooligosyl trehalose hydrolase [Nitrosococcus oceani ATCC 19707]EDZ67143.1 malto-oligosyltrehalose trehalohydrolase [Nitrosococcus oceani AFC27]KFI22729.1 1,4-alpha-glucan branching protein [Nitrosococcus oceani]GEM21328.1 malto-oligosyltrehalose trehalohydrolase [Nitrosococcus oceani]
MQHCHGMPFGAEVTEKGTVRFRLWAPAAKQVELCLEDTLEVVPLAMTPKEEGWFELETKEAGPGSLYCYQINGGMRVPDPASRFQPQDIHGPSEVVDPATFKWQEEGWNGRPWEEAVIYEIHVGTFTPEGTFRGLESHLEHLAKLGVTALELMPVADFPGRWNWGYDGVSLFAPDSRYGRPHDLKSLVQAAHACGLMIFLDVVYNHFGPEGNYLHQYAPDFFTERHQTPWGAAINFDGKNAHWVRQFFIHNALFWLEEYQFDGLRLDAVHAIQDDSKFHILEELAETIFCHLDSRRRIHLVLENDNNIARYLTRKPNGQPRWYTAQWNDDIHHALHVLTTQETTGYYLDYADQPIAHLGRCLSEGFGYQGQHSPYREGKPRGEPSKILPPSAFVTFFQNHDQVGNRAFGERITALITPEEVKALTALLLLSPFPPLLFMGQEWGSTQPFPFFCDFSEDLAASVREGRRREFAHFPEFNNPAAQERIPDPTAQATFDNAVLNWTHATNGKGKEWFELHQNLLKLRRQWIIPRLAAMRKNNGCYIPLGKQALQVRWQLGDGAQLTILANLGKISIFLSTLPSGEVLFTTFSDLNRILIHKNLPPKTVIWFLKENSSD